MSLMEQVGFADVESPDKTGFRTSQYTVGVLFKAIKIA
jgi:hypothetical protein